MLLSILGIVRLLARRSLGKVGLCLELQGVRILPILLTGIGNNESEVVDIVLSMVANARYRERSYKHPTWRLLLSRGRVSAESGHPDTLYCLHE